MDAPHRIRIGTAGWSYKDWNGVFYPPEVGRKKLHPLEYLARFFDVVEINTSFYGPLKPELVKLWCAMRSRRIRNFSSPRNCIGRLRIRRSRDGAHFGGHLSSRTTKMKPTPAKAWMGWPEKGSWARCSSSSRFHSRTRC